MKEFLCIPDLSVLAGVEADARSCTLYQEFWRRRHSLRQILAVSEKRGELPVELWKNLVSRGILRLLLPKQVGGWDLEPASVLRVLEELASVSGSLAWTAMVACETPILLSFLPRDTFEALYAQGPDIQIASSSIPSGQAQEVPGGWKISGIWPFMTGSAHCHFVLVYSRTVTGSLIATLHPRENVTFLADWQPLGLKATSSGSVRIQDAFVPKAWTFQVEQAKSCFPTAVMNVVPSEHFALQMAAVALGIVRHALETASAVNCPARVSPKRKFEEGVWLGAIGEALALTHIARPALYQAMVELLKPHCQSDTSASVSPSLPEHSSALAIARYLVERCIVAVESLFSLSGSGVIFDGHELQQCVCDIRCIAQHANLSPGRFAQLGADFVEVSQERSPVS